jgi:hypothetical protein
VAPPRRSLPWWTPLALLLAYLAGAAIVLHLGGVAGYRLGFLWAALVLAGGGALLLLVGTDARFPGRWLWLATVVLLGVTASGWLVDHAPMSKARLAAEIDRIDLPFVRVLGERRRGHSWCRPTCPVVERTLRAPNTTTFKTILDVAALMRVHGMLPDLEPVGRRHPEHFLRVPGPRTVTEIRADSADGYIRLVITIRARRGPVRHLGPIQSDSWTSSRIE